MRWTVSDQDDFDDDLEHGIYRRPPAEYLRPAHELSIAGPLTRDVRGTEHHERVLAGRCAGQQATAELVPEPGNPWDSTAVAVDIDGQLAGYLNGATAASFHHTLDQANQLGYCVTTPATLRQDPAPPFGHLPDLTVAVALPYAAELAVWLVRPAAARSRGYEAPVSLSIVDVRGRDDVLSAALDGRRLRLLDVGFVEHTVERGKEQGIRKMKVRLGEVTIGLCDDCSALDAGETMGVAAILDGPTRPWVRVFRR